MASQLSRGQLIIQKENLGGQNKKVVIGGNSKSTKTTAKKTGVGLGGRKALENITNKSSVHRETSSKKQPSSKAEFNIADEMFLHDHKKCIESQKAASKPCFLDIVLPGHDSISPAEYPQAKQAKIHLDSPCKSPKLIESPMSEFFNLWNSSKLSPVNSPPSSPFAWDFDPVEFQMKPEYEG